MTLRVPAARGLHEEVVRKSRFVAHVERVRDLHQTLEFYESVADPSATHNCWAWRLGHQYRFNDDGEPGGTAGKPILAAIDGKSVDQAMIVVTRHYGGIKLGVGGLVRAYGGAAARAIDQAGIREVKPRIECIISAGFEWTGPVHQVLESLQAAKRSESFNSNGAEITISLLLSDFERLKSMLRDATRGQASVRRAQG
jgi:uncharacterized YigZ family protein